MSRQDPSRQLFSLQVDLVMLGFGILDTHMKPQFPRQLIRFILGVGIGIIAASVTWCGSVFVYFFGNGRSEVELLIAGTQRGQFLFAWPLIGGLLAVPSRWGAVAVLVGICVHVAGALSHIVALQQNLWVRMAHPIRRRTRLQKKECFSSSSFSSTCNLFNV